MKKFKLTALGAKLRDFQITTLCWAIGVSVLKTAQAATLCSRNTISSENNRVHSQCPYVSCMCSTKHSHTVDVIALKQTSWIERLQWVNCAGTFIASTEASSEITPKTSKIHTSPLTALTLCKSNCSYFSWITARACWICRYWTKQMALNNMVK